MPHEGNLLQAAVVFLFAAVLTVPLAKRLQLGAVLGYLFAGVIIGPSVLGLIGNPQSVSHISELGVVLLLKPSFQAGQEWAALVGLCGGLLAGWAYLQVRELSLLGEPAWRVVFYLSLVGMAMSAVWATVTGWHLPTLESLPYLLGIGATSLLAQLAMTHAYRVGQKFTVAALAYLTVVFSTLVGIFFLGDKIGWQEWLGMGIIVASGVLSAMKR